MGPHLALQGYGYFIINRSELKGLSILEALCPNCGGEVLLQSRRPPRTLWVPGPLGRPWPRDMQVIEEEPVWEVEAGD